MKLRSTSQMKVKAGAKTGGMGIDLNLKVTRRAYADLIRLILGTAVFGIVGLKASQAAAATTYNITTTSMANSASDRICTFPEALIAVNTQAAWHECAAGTGTDFNNRDIISLKVGTYTFNPSGPNAPIHITKSVQIQSASSPTLVTIKQGTWSTPPTTGIFVNIDFSGSTDGISRGALFRDIDFVGQGSTSKTIPATTGIFANGSENVDQLDLAHCWVESFTASGINAQEIALFIDESAIDNNTAGDNGGGIFIESGNPNVYMSMTNSSITRTKAHAGLQGQMDSGFAEIISSSITDNKGSGIQWGTTVSNSSLEIVGSTVAFNTSDPQAPGLMPQAGGVINNFNGIDEVGNTVLVWGSIISDNKSNGPNTFTDFSGDLNSMTYSLLGTTKGANVIESDATDIFNFKSGLDTVLKDNGGFAGGRRPSGGPGYTHTLTHGSICIDVIPADSDGWATDVRGKPRGVDYHPGGNTFDLGAIELQLGE